MKSGLVLIGYVLLSLLFSLYAEESATVDDLYMRVRAELEVTSQLTPLQNISTTDELQKRRYAMAEFLCGKFAAQERLDLIDAMILRDVAGIDLIWSEKLVSGGVDLDKFIQESFLRFKRDFQTKVFDNPSEAIVRTSAALQQKNPEKLTAAEVMPFRQYGVFGVPALITEVKRSGSKHAFAVLLILLGNREEYARYLEKSSTLYPDKAAKLEAVRDAVRSQDAHQKVRTQLLDRIVAATS